MDMFADVKQFHKHVLNVNDGWVPKGGNYRALLTERLKFLQEELTEYQTALMDNDKLSQLVGIVDSLIDVTYVALGTLYMLGIPVEDCWFAVHSCNMAKEPGETKRKNSVMPDAHKPEGWVGPEGRLRELLRCKAELMELLEERKNV